MLWWLACLAANTSKLSYTQPIRIVRMLKINGLENALTGDYQESDILLWGSLAVLPKPLKVVFYTTNTYSIE